MEAHTHPERHTCIDIDIHRKTHIRRLRNMMRKRQRLTARERLGKRRHTKREGA